MKYQGKELRLYPPAGRPTHVVTSDLAKVLGMAKGRFTRFAFDQTSAFMKTKGGTQAVKLISVEDAYILLMKSTKQEAEDLRKWFYKNVIEAES